MALGADPRPFLDEWAPKLIAEYYERYTGRGFDTLGGGGCRKPLQNVVTSDDLVALALLSAPVEGLSVLPLLEVCAADITRHLKEIPTGVPLWHHDAVKHVTDGSPADQLWHLLTGPTVPGMGWVRAGKLLARKRPFLIPPYDEVVRAALHPTRGDYWLALWDELQDPEFVDLLVAARAEAQLPSLVADVSLLRVLDVAVWMRNQGIAKSCYSGQVDPIPFNPRTT